MKTIKFLLPILVASILVTIEGAALEDQETKDQKQNKKIKNLKGNNFQTW